MLHKSKDTVQPIPPAHRRHSRERGNPDFQPASSWKVWMPSYEGMTSVGLNRTRQFKGKRPLFPQGKRPLFPSKQAQCQQPSVKPAHLSPSFPRKRESRLSTSEIVESLDSLVRGNDEVKDLTGSADRFKGKRPLFLNENNQTAFNI